MGVLRTGIALAVVALAGIPLSARQPSTGGGFQLTGRLLRRLGPEARRATRDGADPSSLLLPDGSRVGEGNPGEDYSVDAWTVDAGGGSLTGADYTLRATAGQPDGVAGSLVGGGYQLVHGYWTRPPSLIFGDGFESGTTVGWTRSAGQGLAAAGSLSSAHR